MGLRQNVTKYLNTAGQLVEQGPKTLQELTAQRGLVASPTTPLGAGMLGANPDQAKMAGTPAQKQMAVQKNTDQITTTSEAAQGKVYDRGLTSAEQQAGQSAKKLAPLEGSAARAQSAVDAAIKRMSTPVAATPAALKLPEGLDAGNATVVSSYKAVQDLLASGKPPTDPAVVGQMNTLRTATGKSQQELEALLTGQVDAQTQQAATALGKSPASIPVTQMDLGVPPAELAGLLGIPESALGTMTIQQLSDKLDQLGAGSEQTQELAGSAAVGAAERASARESFAEQAASGVTDIDSQLNDLASAVQRADTIQFNGKSYTFEELLSDDAISNTLADALADPTGRELEKLRANPSTAPLAEFADKYKAVLTDASAQLKEAVGTAAGIETFNKGIGTFGGVALDPALMKAMFPKTWDTARTSKLTQTPLLSDISKLPPAQQKEMATAINALVHDHPEQAAVLAGMIPRDRKEMLGHPDRLETYSRAVKDQKDWEKASGGSIDDVLGFIFGSETPVDPAQINGWMQNDIALGRMGIGGSKLDMKLLDSNKDGQLDTLAQLRNSVGAQVRNKDSLASIISGQKGRQSLPYQQPAPPTPVAQKAYETLAPVLTKYAKSGTLPPGENKASIAVWKGGLQQLVEQLDGQDYLDLLELPIIKNNSYLLNGAKHHKGKPARDAAEAAQAAVEADARAAPARAAAKANEEAKRATEAEEAKKQAAVGGFFAGPIGTQLPKMIPNKDKKNIANVARNLNPGNAPTPKLPWE